MRYTTAITKKAEFDTTDFADLSKKLPNYTIKMERRSRSYELVQWDATFIKDGEIKMEAMGQIGD